YDRSGLVVIHRIWDRSIAGLRPVLEDAPSMCSSHTLYLQLKTGHPHVSVERNAGFATRPLFRIRGKRACIGEPFTMMQVFLFLTSIVKNFELVLPEGAKASTFEELMAGKLLVVARPRSQK
ncbi:hypothetical protein AVEN_221221-1, partial [Araneus ventricosus]